MRRRTPHDPLLAGPSQGGEGNHAGPELALYRLVRWLLHRWRPLR